MAAKSMALRLVGLLLILGLLTGLGGLAGAAGSLRLSGVQPGAVLSGAVSLGAEAADLQVSYVVFGVDGERPHATNSRPFRFLLDTTELADGPHVLFAEAYSRGGLLIRSKMVAVKVKNGSAALTIDAEISAPLVEAHRPGITALQAAKKPLIPALVSRAPSRPGEPHALLQPLSAEPRVASETASLPVPAVTAPPAAKPGAFSIALNGNLLSSDMLLAIQQGKARVGFRGLLTAAGWEVDWLPSRRAGVASRLGRSLEVQVDSDKALVDGVAQPLGDKVIIAQERLVVPLRPLCQAAQMSLQWEQSSRIARLSSPAAADRSEVAQKH